jgi:hypothetical protein
VTQLAAIDPYAHMEFARVQVSVLLGGSSLASLLEHG